MGNACLLQARNEFEERIIGLRNLERQVGWVGYNKTPEGVALDLLEGSGLPALGVNEHTVIQQKSFVALNHAADYGVYNS